MRRPLDLTLAIALLALCLPAQRNRGGDAGSAWRLLAERHDKNKDGKISGDEYDRGADKFAGLDRDGDGVLTEADFGATGQRRPGGAARGQRTQPTPAQRALARLGAAADADRDGVLSRAEAYGGWPDRLYLIAKDGKVAYAGGRGPFGFKPDELETAITAELDKKD